MKRHPNHNSTNCNHRLLKRRSVFGWTRHGCRVGHSPFTRDSASRSATWEPEGVSSHSRVLAPRAAWLSSCPGGRCRGPILGLRLFLSQYLTQPAVGAGLLAEEAPTEEKQEGQAERQHPPPGLLLLPPQGVLHRPAHRRGSAGGKLDGAIVVGVVLFLAGHRGPGPTCSSPARGWRVVQVAGGPARAHQRPDSPREETAISPRAPFPPRPCAPIFLAVLTRPPVHTTPGSS